MKTKHITGIIAASALLLCSCEDFLTKEPETALAPGTFYSSEAELELGTNRFYALLSGPDDDGVLASDIQFTRTLNSVQQGTRSPNTESWSSAWTYLRYINYYLEHSSNCKDEAIRNRYDGVAYFFRALFYYEKVRKYGDIPYYDYVISDTDWTSLRKPRDSRGYVMQKVMEDLDRAIEMLPDAWPSDALYRLSKNAARALKSRAALFEGTFRKYHTIPDESYEDKTLSAEYFLQLAADAAQEVMQSKKYSLYKGDAYKLGAPYREFFILEDADAKETILSMRFNAEILVRHGIQFTYRNNRHSLTRAFTYHYLMADGSKIQDQPGYETMPYSEQFKNRDPRMAQTIMAPGYYDLNGLDEVIEDIKTYDLTGYRIIKFVSDDTHNGATTSTTDWSVFRYPEILLNYAEAKAELGTLTDDDVKQTIDVIRERVGMKGLDMEAANTAPDAFLASYYPHCTGTNQGVLLEIRRERTVELVSEGQRQWDMFRWKEGAQLAPASNTTGGFLGCYFPSLGEFDMNGDGKNDICLWSGDKKPASECDTMLEVGAGKDIELTEGDKGYVICFKDQTYKWDEGRDYLWPIPVAQRQITQGALSQNPGYNDGLTY